MTAAAFGLLIDRQVRDDRLHRALRDGLAHQIARGIAFDGLSAGQRAGEPGEVCSWDVSTAYWSCTQVPDVEIEWETYEMDPATREPVVPLVPLGFRLTVPREDGTTGSIIIFTRVLDPLVFNTTDYSELTGEITFSHEWRGMGTGWTYTGRLDREGGDAFEIEVTGSANDPSVARQLDFTLSRVRDASGVVRTGHVEARVDDVAQPTIDIDYTVATDGSISSGSVRVAGSHVATLSGTALDPSLERTTGSPVPASQMSLLAALIGDLRAFEDGALFRIAFGECIHRQTPSGCVGLEP